MSTTAGDQPPVERATASDEIRDPFKRRVSRIVVCITLFGSLVALWQVKASNQGSIASRQSQQQAIRAFGAEIAVSTDFERMYGVFAEDRVLQRQQAFARRSQQPDLVRRLGEVRTEFARLSPLAGDGPFAPPSDPFFPGAYVAEKREGADRAALVRAERTEVAQAWGAKADGYVAVLTVLAVALLLIGLSLTVESGRRALVVAGLAVAVAGAAWSATIGARELPSTPAAAIDAVGQGHRAMFSGRPGEAIEAYTRAIELRPDYATALGARAQARFLAATPQDLRTTTLINIIDPVSLKAAISDARAAYRHGSDKDVSLVGLLGAFLFHGGAFGESARFTRAAIALNGDLPYLYTNLGIAEAGLGRAEEADRAFDRVIEFARSEKTPIGERQSLYASSRATLDELARLAPRREDLARRLQGRLTAAQMGDVLDLPGEPATVAGATVTNVRFASEGSRVGASMTFRGVPVGTAVGFVWYHRSEEAATRDQAWDQPPHMRWFARLPGDAYDVFVQKSACAVPGRYRLDVYVGAQRIASEQTEVRPGGVGTMVAESDPLIGAALCRPPDWKVDRTAADFLSVAAPDTSAFFHIGTFPLSEAELVQAPQETEATAVSLLTLGYPVSDSGRARRGGVDGLQARYDIGGGIRGLTFASVGSDGTLRVISAVWSPAKLAQLDEVLPTLRFLDVPGQGPA